MGTTGVRLRPLRVDDEPAARRAHAILAEESFDFLLGLDAAPSWAGYVAALDRMSGDVDVPRGLVPATFLVATVDGALVGRTSIRHELNEHLARVGGHIGYAVLPEYRRRGIATDVLRLSLVIARARGVDAVLVTCDVDNTASAAVIERCGGRFDGIVTDPRGSTAPKRHFWFE